MKKLSQKAFALLLGSTMVLSLAGCGSGDSTSDSADNSAAPAEESSTDDSAAPADTGSDDTASDAGSSDAAASLAELSGDLDIWAWAQMMRQNPGREHSKYSLQNILS